VFIEVLNSNNGGGYTQNYIQQSDLVSVRLFFENKKSMQRVYFALKYAIRKVQEKQVELKLNGTHPIQVHADDVSLLGNNVYGSRMKGVQKKNLGN
jgi:hypothetical protein